MLYELLGFRDAEFPAGLGWHDKIAEGFPEMAVWSLSKALRVPQDETGFLVGIPRGTLDWKNRKQKLTPGASATLHRVAIAYHRLFALFKDEEVVSNWLRTPRRELGGLVPIVMLASQPGAELVLQVIDKIKPPKPVQRSEHAEAAEGDSGDGEREDREDSEDRDDGDDRGDDDQDERE